VFPEGASSGDKFYEGNAIVTGYNISASFDGMVEAEMTFTGTGTLSLSTS
jgi:predicted secreted protein